MDEKVSAPLNPDSSHSHDNVPARKRPCKWYTYGLTVDGAGKPAGDIQKLSTVDLPVPDVSNCTEKQIREFLEPLVRAKDKELFHKEDLAESLRCIICKVPARRVVHSAVLSPPKQYRDDSVFCIVDQAGPICPVGSNCELSAIDRMKTTIGARLKERGILEEQVKVHNFEAGALVETPVSYFMVCKSCKMHNCSKFECRPKTKTSPRSPTQRLRIGNEEPVQQKGPEEPDQEEVVNKKESRGKRMARRFLSLGCYGGT